MDKNANSPTEGSVLDHIGIAVRNLKDVVKIYQMIGLEPGECETVADQGVRLQIIPVGNTRIELLQPINEESQITKYLNEYGEGLHHIALTVRDIRETLNKCKSNGIRPIDEDPRVGAGGSLIAFLHPRNTGSVLIELVQSRGENSKD